MNLEEYGVCLSKYEKGEYARFSWEELATKLGYDNGEKLRRVFRTEHRKKTDGMNSENTDKRELSSEKSTYEQGRDFINVICSSERILSQEDIIKQFNIDTTIWEVDKYTMRVHEGYRKDRRVQWRVENGKVLEGNVDDTGKMLVVPLYSVEVHLVRKVKESNIRNILQEFLKEAKSFVPVYKKIEYENLDENYLLEINLPDLHFGRGTWSEESGIDSGNASLRKDALTVVDKLLQYGKLFKIGKIVIPLGNDYYNADGHTNATASGTPMQEDDRPNKTFREGWKLAIEIIDRCSEIAPVDVLLVPGNHDANRLFYLGEVLSCWYDKNPNVKIDNTSKQRKYFSFGNCLVGFAHGSEERMEKLPMIMATEVPAMWAESKFREFHCGHWHQKKDAFYFTLSDTGVMVRVLRSLAVPDKWSIGKGFVNDLRCGESFVWNKQEGLVAQFTANV